MSSRRCDNAGTNGTTQATINNSDLLDSRDVTLEQLRAKADENAELSDFQKEQLYALLCKYRSHERNVQRPIGRPSTAATQVVRLEECGRKHWPIPSATRRRCRVCAEKGVTRNVSVICERCKVALCCDRRCFVDYHNKADP